MKEGVVKDLAKKWYELFDFPREYDDEFVQLLEEIDDIEPIKIADFEKRRNEFDEKETFVLFLYYMQETFNEYKARGISSSVFFKSLATITGSVSGCKKNKGYLGIEPDLADWMMLFITCGTYRFTRYQIGLREALMDVPHLNVKKGDNILDIHIPRDGKLSAEKMIEEINQANEFFAKYFPEKPYEYFTCFSWLLGSNLKKFLPEEANIIKFQNLFEVVHEVESEDIFRYMYDFRIKDRSELNDWQPQSSFAKVVKEEGLKGTKFYESYGFIHKDKYKNQ